MALEASVSENCVALTSGRATERKKSAEVLKGFLSRNAVPSLLTENAMKKKGFSWDDVFRSVNDFILKETEKYEISKNFENVTVPLCSTLLHLCIAGSNKGRAYIKCERITEASLFILKDERLTKAMGEAYVSILLKHVLTSEHYINHFTPHMWEDLLEMSNCLCLSRCCNIDDYTKLKLISLILKNGSTSCQFAIAMRTCLPSLKKCFNKVNTNDKKMQEMMIDISTILLQTLTPECRLTMCEFMENILPSVLKYYNQNIDNRNKNQLFTLLHLTLILHHPKGRTQCDEGSLAEHWGMWNKHLESILEIVCLEVNFTQRLRKATDYTNELFLSFCELAAELYFQIFNLKLTLSCEECANTSKRQKMTINNNNSISDLINEMRQTHVPWVGIIQSYIKKFGINVSVEEYLSLLQMMEVFVTDTTTVMSIYGCTVQGLVCDILKNLIYLQCEKELYSKAILALWSSCVRHSTQVTAHAQLHSMLQAVLALNILHYADVQPLVKLYHDKTIPVTTSSVITMNYILYKFSSKYALLEDRYKCFEWLLNGTLSNLDMKCVNSMMLQLISNDPVYVIDFMKEICNTSNNEPKCLYEVLFETLEECILFSEFDYPLPETCDIPAQNIECIEINDDMHKEVEKRLKQNMLVYIDKMKTNDIDISKFISMTRVAVAYTNIMLKHKLVAANETSHSDIYNVMKQAVDLVYATVTTHLDRSGDVLNKVKVLELVQDMLLLEYDDPVLNIDVRTFADTEFFHCLHKILNAEDASVTEEHFYESDDEELNPNILKNKCVCVLAAYCRKNVSYRNELLQIILDDSIYNFTNPKDVNCAFQCIQLLTDNSVEQPPIEGIFRLMQHMCKALFRNSDATFELVKILIGMIEQVWREEGMRHNCIIMVEGYLRRCSMRYYTPRVVASVHTCVAKILDLSRTANQLTETFRDALITSIRNDTHTIRLHCCYLLQRVTVDCESYLDGLSELFTMSVSESTQQVLKDEAANRTLTLLHALHAQALAARASTPSCTTPARIVTRILRVHSEKSLDKRLTKKVINTITNTITNKTAEVYLNANILSILHSWFVSNEGLEGFPFELFGFDDLDMFITKHVKWLIPADALWCRQGHIDNSHILPLLHAERKQPLQQIIEMCFCNIMLVCLPYIVTHKYKLNYKGDGSHATFQQTSKYAENMFQRTRQILDNDKWSNLFVENMGQLVLLAALHLRDHDDAARTFSVELPAQTGAIFYPKPVFSAILRYYGELIDCDIMQYLCEHLPLTIFHVLFRLWENVISDTAFGQKVVSNIHTFISFVQCIPLGYGSDAFVCNFTCNSFTHAIRNSRDNKEIAVLVEAQRIVLSNYLPSKVNALRKSVSELLPILIIKREEGYVRECAALLHYLTIEMKDYLNESQDVVDFINTLSQGAETVKCPTKQQFISKLKAYKLNLNYPSHETLQSLRHFLQVNKELVNVLCEQVNDDDPDTRLSHQIINALVAIIRITLDDKTKIEACNCLSEIGTYDLKTFVTVSSAAADTDRVHYLTPAQYLAHAVVNALLGVMYDVSPQVTSRVTATLTRLLKYRQEANVLGMEGITTELIKPFASAECEAAAQFKINTSKFDSCGEMLWIPKPSEDHVDWLKRITTLLLDMTASSSNYLESLRGVCDLKPRVCRLILPSVTGLIVYCSSEKQIQTISKQINNFFTHNWEKTYNGSAENSMESNPCKRFTNELDCNQKEIVQYMLDVVDVIRLQRSHYNNRSAGRKIETLNYLSVECDKVAWAATVAGQNLDAIYYSELWAMAQNDYIPPASPAITTELPGGEAVQKILRKCFVSIGELDALEGCGTAHLTCEEEKRMHLINTGEYSDALIMHDIALSSAGPSDKQLQYGVVRSLHKSGMHHLALQYIKSLPESDYINDIKYECLSYLGDWSVFVDTRELEEKSKQTTRQQSIIKAFRYACLKDCLNLHNTQDLQIKLAVPLNGAKLAVSRLCRNLNLENCQNLYKVLGPLHLFSDIEDYNAVRCDNLPVCVLFQRWAVERLPPSRDFNHLEALLAQRSLILEHAAKTFNCFLKEIVTLQLDYTKLSLTNRRIELAQRLLASVKRLQSSQQVDLVESQILWAKGHKDIALSLLRNTAAAAAASTSTSTSTGAGTSTPTHDVKLSAVALRQYGMWMAESKYDNARDIINKYLKKSLDVRGEEHAETRVQVYHDIARFADAEYKQVAAYITSHVFQHKLKCVENMKHTVTSLSATQDLTRGERKAMNENARLSVLDEADIANTKAEKQQFLHLAMRYYMLSLKQCEVNNLSVFRVISLWLDNPGLECEWEGQGEGEGLGALLHAIPSRKYLVALPQLAPRLSADDTHFARHLAQIISRCAKEHPHHTLPILFSLKNTDKDNVILNASARVSARAGAGAGRNAGAGAGAGAEPRVLAAERLVAELARAHSTEQPLADIIHQMEKLCNATISLANYVPKSKDAKHKIPVTEPLHNLRNLDAVPIPTDAIPISHTCTYTHIHTLMSFENYYETVGGINCPKKITCTASNGDKKILLIKGDDDLRQDAVMQQVFGIVNTLLRADRVTRRSKLLVRTYKVVPMSRRSGVIEWCVGTIPIGAYLVGRAGAHARYRPQDISCQAARTKLQSCHDARKPNSVKLATFNSILSQLRPVFHYFFTEHYLDPVTWFERRLAYTKSVATSSMVGYIMGLGDRHVQNILIDKGSAEVVHIDFGIAFDQGKTLPTPETVPFRLTQDMIAGFGCSGVEGTFRRCCEKTMQLLRDNHETLLTILEVLLCDPLYSWTVTTPRQNVASPAPAPQGAGLAARALLAVRGKLSGAESGAGGVAVRGHVAHLIRCATDPSNLARLYPGWQPYL